MKVVKEAFIYYRRLFLQKSGNNVHTLKRMLNETGLEDAFQISGLYNVTFASLQTKRSTASDTIILVIN